MELCTSTVGYGEEQIMKSEKCTEHSTSSIAMVLLNNDHLVTIMDTSSMIDNAYALQKNSIYYYFSSTFEVRVYG